MTQDPFRPRSHFTAPSGWLNDPNGLCQWEGTWHLFYQHNPHAPVHHRIHWGHATSPDLVHWRDEPIALSPGEGADRDGCWSGVLVDDGGVPTIVYSGRHGDSELPCVAVGSPDLRHWTPSPANPVIAAKPEGTRHEFRDHTVFRWQGAWRQLIGTGTADGQGAAWQYESDDLVEWRDLGPVLTAAPTVDPDDPLFTASMWECVDLFHLGPGELGDREGIDVLAFSAWQDGVTLHPLAWLGRYTGERFEPNRLVRLDHGGRFFYAPQSFTDQQGRRIQFGWMQEGRTEESWQAGGWCGVMSWPRQLEWIDDDLHVAPVPETELLRTQQVPFEGLAGDCLDLEVEAELDPDGQLRLGVLTSQDETTTVVVTRERVLLDRSRSSLDAAAELTELSGPIRSEDGRVTLRVIVDCSAVEVFVNGRALSGRVYPTRSEARVVLEAGTGTGARVLSAEAWRLGVAVTR